MVTTQNSNFQHCFKSVVKNASKLGRSSTMHHQGSQIPIDTFNTKVSLDVKSGYLGTYKDV